MIARTAPEAPPQTALTEAEMTVIDRAVRNRSTMPAEKTLLHYLSKVACLGGYLARARDRPPGNTFMWRSRSRRMDILLGADLMQPKCGKLEGPADAYLLAASQLGQLVDRGFPERVGPPMSGCWLCLR